MIAADTSAGRLIYGIPCALTNVILLTVIWRNDALRVLDDAVMPKTPKTPSVVAGLNERATALVQTARWQQDSSKQRP
jgi:hypothetical protein